MIMISTVFVFVIIISKNATKNTHKLTSLLPLSLSLPFGSLRFSFPKLLSLSPSSLCSLSLPNLSLFPQLLLSSSILSLSFPFTFIILFVEYFTLVLFVVLSFVRSISIPSPLTLYPF